MMLIVFTSDDGEEREERWRSVDAFRSWAVTQRHQYSYTAYREDEDGEWIVVGGEHQTDAVRKNCCE